MQKLIMNISGVKLNLFIILISLFSCQNLIKNKDVIKDEISTIDTVQGQNNPTKNALDSAFDELFKEGNYTKASNNEVIKSVNNSSDLIGNWVGWFEPDLDDIDNETNKTIYRGVSFEWNRQNKINISIDKITDDKVLGHSVVAGNNRKFEGIITDQTNLFKLTLEEPGGNKYDGVFELNIYKNQNKLEGVWISYNQKIDIPKRKYTLSKTNFSYNQSIQLDKKGWKRFIDWESKSNSKEEFSEDFVSATDKIYSINASTKLLTKAEVENLKKGDLLIIRNMIYARHGYSFKNRPLRVFFDAQDWYMPIHTDIKAELTDIEKKNIELILKYEKNAKEYYDYFGRG